jgi:hypothetical protein
VSGQRLDEVPLELVVRREQAAAARARGEPERALGLR